MRMFVESILKFTAVNTEKCTAGDLKRCILFGYRHRYVLFFL